MAWFAYIKTSDGALISLGTALTTPLPVDTTVLPLTIDPTDTQWMYDQTSRTFIARPAKVLIDRLQDIITNVAYQDLIDVWQTLNTNNRNKLRNGLIKLLGKQRWRGATEVVELDG